jgi:hypothetical protein
VTDRIQLNSTPRRVCLAAVVFVLVAANFMIGKWGFANMVSTRADDTRIAELLSARAEVTRVADLAVELGPSDPQTHYAAAVLFDRTFLASDQQQSLEEYKTATALSPHNYLLWLEYGKALGRNGDDRAEAAFRRAQELAPNYAAVQWALGNLLVREDKLQEGFAEIRRAVEGDETLAVPATAFAYQFFNGDANLVRQNIGSTPDVSAALALTLVRDKRYDDAAAVWTSMGDAAAGDALSEQRATLVNNFIAAKKFRLAFAVSPGSAANGAAIDRMNDGGFEQSIKLENAGPFEWQISPGSQPQPLQSTSQQHGGQRALVLRFSSNDGAGLRQLSQTVIVTPGAKYGLHGFYRSDVRSDAHPTWQVVSASGAVLAEASVSAAAADWTPFEAAFTVPADSDGIEIRLIVKGCDSAICPISGSLWLDDLSITRN